MITLEKILLNYNPENKNILPALLDVSAAFGYVSKNNAKETADYFSVPLSEIYETASFYDLINVKKQPEIIIQVCSSINCAVNNSSETVKEIENYFHIKKEADNHPKIKLETVSCLGRCEEGPIMIINEKIYTRVTKSSVHEILEEYI
jgi:NADH-quinone oxidoreductase subunit E